MDIVLVKAIAIFKKLNQLIAKSVYLRTEGN